MALTKPKLSQNIDTDISVFTDPILVLHQGSSLANVDTGFLLNRANGLVNNVAIYWSEGTKSFVTAFTDSTGAPDSNVNVLSYANLRSNVTTVESIYTASGVYWSGNGQAWSSGGGAFSQVRVTGGNTILANAEGVSTLTIVGGSGITVTANPDTDTLTFTTVSTAESIWVTDHDSGLVTDAVVLSEDNGLVTDVAVNEYDLGTITITGVITGDTIAVNSMPGNRLIAGTDISVGNISASGQLSGSFVPTGSLIPFVNASYDLGNVTYRWDDLYLSGSVTATTGTIGNVTFTSANLGVGTATPDLYAKLTSVTANDVNTIAAVATDGMIRIKGYATGATSGVIEATNVAQSSYAPLFINGSILKFGTNDTEHARIHTNGNVVMLNNVSISKSLGVGTAVAGNIGEIRATNYITAFYSDKRLKSNIEPITSALDKVKHLAGVLYTQNTLAEQYGYNDYGQQVGLFAQDVQQVLPQAVKPAPFDIGPNGTSISGQNYLTIQYEKMVPLLVEAIKELSDIVDQLKEH